MDSAHQVDSLIVAARKAQSIIADYNQDQIDTMVRAMAWAIYKYEHAKELAEIAVFDTGLGNVEDKITKNRRKTFGTLCDLLDASTVGVIEENAENAIITFAKPVGVVGTLTPSTNPAATPANHALMAIKGGNAIIICPSPAGLNTANRLKRYFDDALRSIDAPVDIVQIVNGPINFDKATYLMSKVDLAIVTGDQTNVKRGYQSGTPCIGVGKGNVPVIIDNSANFEDAATKIALSKTFDNATSCSSENSVILLEESYHDAIEALKNAGGYYASPEEVSRIERILFDNGNVNREAVGKSIEVLFELFELGKPQDGTKFILVDQSKIGKDFPLSGEKLSLVMSVYRANNFSEAVSIVQDILNYEGLGHSVGVHTHNFENSRILAEKTKVARVLVNQAHTFGNGGGFDNALPFSLTMGCGTWAGNSISENLNISHFINKTVLVSVFEKQTLSENDAFGSFFEPKELENNVNS